MAADPRVSDAVETSLAKLREELSEIIEERLAAERATHLDALTVARTEVETRWAGRLAASEAKAADERAELESRLADARLEHQAAVAAQRSEWRDERADSAARLVAAIRQLDESSSLTGILDTIGRATLAESDRAAVLIVESGVYRSWGAFGVDLGSAPLVPQQAQLIHQAATSRLPVKVSAADGTAPGN